MSLFSALSVSASGMAAQRTRAELLTENLANAETTRTPEGGPYRRKDAVFVTTSSQTDFQSMFTAQLDSQPKGVAVSEVVIDSREPVMRYLPGHPDADSNGYVGFPHVNPAEDMVDLMSTSRNFQANVSAITSVKDMIQKSLDILR